MHAGPQGDSKLIIITADHGELGRNERIRHILSPFLFDVAGLTSRLSPAVALDLPFDVYGLHFQSSVLYELACKCVRWS